MKRIDKKVILERQLTEAKKALFKASTIRQLKLIQDRIRYLNERIKELGEKK